MDKTTKYVTTYTDYVGMNWKTQYCERCETDTEWWDVDDTFECVRCKTQ